MTNTRFNRVLRRATREIGSHRPLVPTSIQQSLHYEQTAEGAFARFWFRTRGCAHSIAGGCTMCDYWISTPVDAEATRAAVDWAVDELRSVRPAELLIETSGSFFDRRELPPDLRRWMVRRFAELPLGYLVVETRSDMLDDEVLASAVADLRPTDLVVELGVESLDPWVLKHCINKDTGSASVETAVRRIHHHGAFATANVLVGTPFLSLNEQIQDSIRTVRGVLDMGFDNAVVFPVSVKRHTLTGWLWDRGLYRQPSLWALVDVLRALDPEVLGRVFISWHRPRTQIPPGQTAPIGPTTCPACYETVATLMDRWRSEIDRPSLLREIDALQCACRMQHDEDKEPPTTPLAQRVQELHREVAAGLLGPDWERFVDELPDHDLTLSDAALKGVEA